MISGYLRVDNPDIPMNVATQSHERYKVRVGNGHQAIIPFLESPTKHPQFDTGTNTDQDAPPPWSLDEAQCICSRNAHDQNADMPEESDARVSYCLVHGCKLVKWTEHEKDGFLLGLYIFGKDFVKLRRFVEGKDLSDLLDYYYGSFWRSEKHIEWSKVRKSKKCSLGSKLSKGGKGVLVEKVFSSTSKRMMLISHLVQRASTDECQISLLQVGKMYATNNAKIDEFFFAVKSIVGLQMLVEAVGIGHGEGALTIPTSSTATRRSARRRTMSEKAMSSTITEAFFNRKRPVVQAPSEPLVADQQARNNYQNESSQELIHGSKLLLPSLPGEVSFAEADEKNDQEMSHKSSDHTMTILARNSSTESTITASRRSTRSRSMTAKALYAVADGFLDFSSPNKKRHGHPL